MSEYWTTIIGVTLIFGMYFFGLGYFVYRGARERIKIEISALKGYGNLRDYLYDRIITQSTSKGVCALFMMAGVSFAFLELPIVIALSVIIERWGGIEEVPETLIWMGNLALLVYELLTAALILIYLLELIKQIIREDEETKTRFKNDARRLMNIISRR